MLDKPFQYVDQRIKDLFWARVNKTSDCWLWTGGIDKDGYGVLQTKISLSKLYPFKAHRLSWYLHNGDPEKMCVLHQCDNPPCVNPDHLFLGTMKDNTGDMMLKGRNRMPSQALLSYEIAQSIREKIFVAEKLGAPITQREVAVTYGVHYKVIWKIVHNKVWTKPNYLEARR